MKRLLSVLVTACMALSLTACGGSGSGSSVTMMSELDIMSMDSTVATDGMSFEAIQATIDGLYGYAEDGTIEKALADTDEVSADGLTHTITLKDAEWSNGTAVTANDFVYAWRRIIKNAGEYAYMLGSDGAAVKNADKLMAKGDLTDKDMESLGITAKDDKTLVIELENPCSYFEKLMAFVCYFPINEEFAEKQGDQYALSPDNLLSCGAYTLADWQTGASATFTKNETYYDADSVKADSIVVNLAQDQSAAATQFESGDLDYCTINSSLVDEYKNDEAYITFNEGYLWYLQINQEDANLKNLNIRKGLSASINREDFATNVLKDGSSPTIGFVPQQLSQNSDGTDFADSCGDLLDKNGIAYDADKAQEYIDAGLKELGKKEITIEITYGTDESPADQVATYLQKAFSGLDGVKVKMRATTKKTRINEYQKKHDFQVSVTRWGPDYADPTTYLNLMQQSQIENGNNYGSYRSDKYDALMNKIKVETDAAKREEMMQQCNEILMEDVAIIPVFQKGSAGLQSTSLKGMIHNSVGTPKIWKYLSKE